MKVFTRHDGRNLRVLKGFRDQVLSAPRVSAQPKPNWSDEDYSLAADKKLREAQRLLSEFSRWGSDISGARVLEVGCGAGIDCLLMGLQPVHGVVGIDLQTALFQDSEKGERTRRLTRKVLEKLDLGVNITEVLHRLPVRFVIVNATQTGFPDDSFDFLWSRAAMEHIIPVDKALIEMARMVRPGGLIYHSIDPYFWLKGCHKTGLVDIPWAHARLSPEEFHRFVIESEGKAKAIKRCRHLKSLNQFTLTRWREIIEAGPFETLEWKEERSPFAETLLEEHPEVEHDLLDGVERRDLIHGQIKVWLRNEAKAGIMHGDGMRD